MDKECRETLGDFIHEKPGGDYPNHSYIFEPIEKIFHFCAAIEITNDIKKDIKKRSDYKQNQARDSKKVLQTLVNHNAEVRAGLCYFDSKKQIDSSDIDFQIILSKYDETILRNISYRTIGQMPITSRSKLLLERMLEKSYLRDDVTMNDFMNPSTEFYELLKKDDDINKETYTNHVSQLRGLIIELYLYELFDITLTDKRLYHRSDVNVTHDKQEIDLIVATHKNDFYNALKELDEKKYFKLEY
jgi:hypothetical protein